MRVKRGIKIPRLWERTHEKLLSPHKRAYLIDLFGKDKPPCSCEETVLTVNDFTN